MSIKKMLMVIAASAACVAALSVTAGANCLMEAKDPDRALTSSSSIWQLRIYNDPAKNDEFVYQVENNVDYSKITGVKFIVTVPEKDSDGADGNRDFWDGGTGGGVVFSVSGGDIEQGTDAWDTYHWPSRQFWGVYDEALEIFTDPNKEDGENGKKDISYEKVSDYTYQLIANDFVNPLANGVAKDIGCMQVCLQEWGSSIAQMEVLKCEVLDEAGNALLAFDGNGKLIENADGSDNVSAEYLTEAMADGTLKVTGYTGTPVDLEIPETINGKKVTQIDKEAFSHCSTLRSVTIPDSVTKIDVRAFMNCKKLESVKIPSGVTQIGAGAFAGCSALKSVNIPDSVTKIGNEAFSSCTSLKTVKIGNGVKEIGQYAFDVCRSLKSVIIPSGVTSIGDKAFGFARMYGNVEGFKIYCYSGTAGEKYAKNNKLTYELLPAKVTGAKLGGRAADALRINWTKNASADGYIVEMYQGNKWVRVAKITSNSTTTFRKAGLKAGTVYKFRVKAYKMCGTTAVYSAYSTTVTARTNPSVIKDAKLGGRAADALRINWTKNASADGYIIEMYQGNKWVRAGKITNNSTTTFRKAELKASTVYKFRVRAYKMSGSTALYGNYSATVTARTNPSIMKGVKIAGKAKDALRVNWTKNSSAQGYIVEMYKGGKWVRAAKITNNNTTTFRKAGLAKNTTYKFRVKAYYMSGKTALYGNYGSVSGKTLAK